MASLDEALAEDELRKAYNRVLLQLTKAKASQAELVEAVYQAAHDAAAALAYKPVPKPKKHKGGDSEVAISLLSDFQLAKVTPSYSSAVCEERVIQLASKVSKLTEIQRADHPVNECRVYLLGDLIEGELIFPGQAYRIDASLFQQVMVDGPRILGDYLRFLLSIFPSVHVVSVVGNHGSLGGRARRDYHPESNADAMMYEATRIMLAAEERLTWTPTTSPGERLWWAADDVGQHRFFLFHGDQIRGGQFGFPWYGFGRRLQGWQRITEFDYAVSGHFHTPVRGYYTGGIRHWGNGSTESDNTYAAENLAAASDPSQWLLYVHPEQGVTAEYEVRL